MSTHREENDPVRIQNESLSPSALQADYAEMMAEREDEDQAT